MRRAELPRPPRFRAEIRGVAAHVALAKLEDLSTVEVARQRVRGRPVHSSSESPPSASDPELRSCANSSTSSSPPPSTSEPELSSGARRGGQVSRSLPYPDHWCFYILV